jgi:hypothetical protein
MVGEVFQRAGVRDLASDEVHQAADNGPKGDESEQNYTAPDH